MRNLSSTTRPDGYGKASGKTGNSKDPYGETWFQELIQKANTISLVRIFRFYNLRVDEHNRSKIICPFKSHKGGHESTGSFWYYPETNSFYCYGCHVGGKQAGACEFIAAMEGVSRIDAAYFVIEKFGDCVGDVDLLAIPNFAERLDIMMDFANVVREFRQNNSDVQSAEFIEYVCSIYDKLNSKFDLSNEALRSAVDKMKEKIASFKPCLMP